MENKDSNEFVKILELLNGKLPEPEMQELKNRIKTDPETAKRFEEIKRFQIRAKYVAARNNISAILESEKSVEQPVEEEREMEEVIEMRSEPVVVIRRLWRRPQTWLVAAIVLVAMGLGLNYYLSESIKSPEVAKEHSKENISVSAMDLAVNFIPDPLNLPDVPARFEADVHSLNSNSESGEIISKLDKLGAVTSGNDSKKEEPIYGAAPHSPEKPQKVPALSAKEKAYRLLLMGVGYVKEGNNTEALKMLNQISQENLVQDVSWFKALAYIQQNKNAQARRELEKITDNRYSEKAKELLGTLE